MIISKEKGRHAILSGNATLGPVTTDDKGEFYQAITRFDFQRVDHYVIDIGDPEFEGCK